MTYNTMTDNTLAKQTTIHKNTLKTADGACSYNVYIQILHGKFCAWNIIIVMYTDAT